MPTAIAAAAVETTPVAAATGVSYEERSSRQLDLFPPDRVKTADIIVIGCGAIGRQIALMLAQCGIPRITLVDFDVVEEGNLGVQGWREADLKKTKVEALAAVMKEHNSTMEITLINDKFRRNMLKKRYDAIFCCVDNIETRGLIYGAVDMGLCGIFVDTRMSAQTFHVITIQGEVKEDHEYYRTTLFPASETQGGACTSKSTIFCSYMVAAAAVSTLSKYVCGHRIDKHILTNILSYEITFPKGL